LSQRLTMARRSATEAVMFEVSCMILLILPGSGHEFEGIAGRIVVRI